MLHQEKFILPAEGLGGCWGRHRRGLGRGKVNVWGQKWRDDCVERQSGRHTRGLGLCISAGAPGSSFLVGWGRTAPKLVSVLISNILKPLDF